MIDGYLDESGIHNGAAVCVVAGYFGGRGQWRKFEVDWKQMLREHKVPMEKFHTKDFYPHPKPKTFFRDEWGGDYQAFQEAVAATISRHKKIHPISAGIIVSDFFKFSMDERRFLTGARKRNGKLVTSGCPKKPYFVPFQLALRTICRYAPIGGKAHFFFGIDRPFYEYATVLFKQIKNDDLHDGEWSWKQRLGDPSAPRAANTPQLQAADFIAHLTYHHMLNAKDKIGLLLPIPLLATCLRNRRSQDDFFFSTRTTLQEGLDQCGPLEESLKLRESS